MKPRFVDLTHTLSPDIPHWDDACCFALHTAVDYDDCTAPNLFRVQRFEGKAGIGTHVDAPSHCFPNGKTVDVLDLKELVTDCVVIHAKGADAHYKLMPETIRAFEEEHGDIPKNAFVIVHTGWDAHWGNAKQYRNDLQFPSIHEDAATVLLRRGVAGIGIDTLSPDAGGKDFPVHRVLLGAGKYIVENVANAGQLPPVGAKVTILPMKIAGGTEAPVRMIASVG